MVGGFGQEGSTGFYGSSRSSPRSHSSQNYDSDRERFSRKVFVGGLPPDIDEGEACLLTRPDLTVLYCRRDHGLLQTVRAAGGGLASQGREQVLLPA